VVLILRSIPLLRLANLDFIANRLLRLEWIALDQLLILPLLLLELARLALDNALTRLLTRFAIRSVDLLRSIPLLRLANLDSSVNKRLRFEWIVLLLPPLEYNLQPLEHDFQPLDLPRLDLLELALLVIEDASALLCSKFAISSADPLLLSILYLCHALRDSVAIKLEPLSTALKFL